MRLPAVLLAVLLLTGCTADREDAAPRPTSTATKGPVITWVPPQLRGAFRTPSGNITCEIDAEAVDCRVKDKPWKDLPKQAGCDRADTVIWVAAEAKASLRSQCTYDRDPWEPVPGVLA